MRLFALFLAVLAMPVSADEPLLRPSAGLLFKQPELLRPGQCVLYQEGGGGRLLTEPRYYLKGEVVATQVTTHRQAACPVVPGKTVEQFNRGEFVRYLRALPCFVNDRPARDEQIGLLRLRVMDWETPHARKAENEGRLYRGMFLDQPLEKGLEIDLEADLLALCRS
jgi:hypothetical protein